MADGKEERAEREARIEQQKQENRDDRTQPEDPDYWEPERRES